jgi:hypothetical protein
VRNASTRLVDLSFRRPCCDPAPAIRVAFGPERRQDDAVARNRPPRPRFTATLDAAARQAAGSRSGSGILDDDDLLQLRSRRA